jgi:type IV pilus assembly protein PilW
MTRLPQSRRSGPNAQRGLSLVELMVAMTIGLFLMGAVGIIYVNTSTTSRSSTLESQMNEDAALALELLQQQIRLAGFSNVNNSGDRLFAGRAVRGCDGGFTNNAAGTAFELLACNATGTGSDAISVRYEASLLNSQSVTAAGVQSPGNCAHEGITAWNASAEGAASATPLALADNRYYIANDTDGTPSLFCQGRTGAAFGTATALIPNIEDLQVQYAVTALSTASTPLHHQVAGYVDADHAALGTPAVNWSRVAAIRICLLARTARAAPTGDNSINDLGRYIDCNGAVQTATDRFLRRAYLTTIQLRNMRPGLPSDFQPPGGSSAVNPWTYLYEN